MSFIEIANTTWGRDPIIGVKLECEQRRTTSVDIRMKWTISPVFEPNSFPYSIIASASANGNTLVASHTLKNSSPAQWTDGIIWTSDWYSVNNENNALEMRLASNDASHPLASWQRQLPDVPLELGHTRTFSGVGNYLSYGVWLSYICAWTVTSSDTRTHLDFAPHASSGFVRAVNNFQMDASGGWWSSGPPGVGQIWAVVKNKRRVL